MSKSKASAPTDVFTVINSHFTEQLARGNIPWHASLHEHPKDIDGQPFRGINLWLLAHNQYSRNIYLSKPQILDLNAQVKKRERGHIVLASRESKGKRSVYYHKVYNIDQVEGVDRNTLPPLMKEQRVSKKCCDIFDRMQSPPKIIDIGSHLYYDFEADTIHCPLPDSFKNDRQMYSALFYALVLSTGHPTRLNQELSDHRYNTASRLYSCDELTVEMGCSLLCSYAGIEPWYLVEHYNNAEGWLHKMQKDTTLVSIAAMNADHAVDYILNLSGLKVTFPPDGMF